MLNDARKFKIFFTKGPVGQLIRWGFVVVLAISVVILAGKMLLNDAAIEANNYVIKEVETKITKNPGKIIQKGFLDKILDKKKQTVGNIKKEGRGDKVETGPKTICPGEVNNTSEAQFTAASISNEQEEYTVTPLNLYTAKVEGNTKPMEKHTNTIL